MTQQDIVDAVNRLAAGYNITWADIKTDADKAIYKINSYLGTSYPLMSVILNSPFSHYAVKHDGKYIPIFDDQYIISIVIPYIASELLSRDEEFTTIYNKYLLDVEDGLFTMFSKEFNRVPHVFRQPDTTGVFFAEGMPQKPLECCNVRPLPKFRINYHMNNEVILTTDRYIDTTEYDYNQAYPLLEVPNDTFYYSEDGVYKYTFGGWYTDPICENPAQPGNITSDLDIYARWDCESTLAVGTTKYNGVEYNYPILRTGNNTLKYLNIPEYIDGRYITLLNISLLDNYGIGSDTPCPLETLKLPKSIKYITAYTFDNFKGKDLIFPDDPLADIHIEENALNLLHSEIAQGVYEQCALFLPKSIKSIAAASFSSLATVLNDSAATPSGIREIYIKCAYPFIAKPSTVFPSPDPTNIPKVTRIVVNNNILYRIFYNGD